MTFNEKVALLDEYENACILSEEQFLKLQDFSFDQDEFIRSGVASLLVNFVNRKSMEVLLMLSRDKDELVRTEAYDSLAVFPFNVVEQTLKEAVQTERDDLARSYAILSWADVIVLLYIEKKLYLSFIRNYKSTEKSERCLLSCCYAEYVLGDKLALEELLSFLKSEDYRIRCSAISLLNDVISEDNKKAVVEAIQLLLSTENSLAVKERAMGFLEETYKV